MEGNMDRNEERIETSILVFWVATVNPLLELDVGPEWHRQLPTATANCPVIVATQAVGIFGAEVLVFISLPSHPKALRA